MKALVGFTVLAAALLATGCEEMTTKPDDPKQPTAASLVGSWQIEDYETGEVDPDGVILRFYSGGRLEGRTMVQGATLVSQGTWSLQGSRLTMSLTALGLTVETVATVRVLTATRLCFLAQAEEAEEVCYRRVFGS